jgi:hypothetical protein
MRSVASSMMPSDWTRATDLHRKPVCFEPSQELRSGTCGFTRRKSTIGVDEVFGMDSSCQKYGPVVYQRLKGKVKYKTTTS